MATAIIPLVRLKVTALYGHYSDWLARTNKGRGSDNKMASALLPLAHLKNSGHQSVESYHEIKWWLPSCHWSVSNTVNTRPSFWKYLERQLGASTKWRRRTFYYGLIIISLIYLNMKIEGEPNLFFTPMGLNLSYSSDKFCGTLPSDPPNFINLLLKSNSLMGRWRPSSLITREALRSMAGKSLTNQRQK
jgi:hypothetical protein